MSRYESRTALLVLAAGLMALAGCRSINKSVSEAVSEPGRAKEWNVHYGSRYRYALNNEALEELEFEGDIKAGRVKVRYQRGLAEQAQSIADRTVALLEEVERRIGITIGPHSTIQLLRLDESPQNVEINLKVEPNDFPLPLFVRAGEESWQSILAQNRGYPYLFVHELVEISLARNDAGGRVLPDVGWGLFGLNLHARNYTRWFRDGLANYAGYIAREMACEELAGAEGVSAGRALVHDEPFSALSRTGRKLFSWSQYCRSTRQDDFYNAALGLFLLIEHAYGEQAIRDITAEIARRDVVDGRDLLQIAKEATGADLKQLAADFKFPPAGLKLEEITPALALNRGLDVREGLLVESVEPHGFGARAGLEPNDVIVAVGTVAVAENLDYELAIFKARDSRSIALSVWRAGAGTMAVDLPLWPVAEPAPGPEKRHNPFMNSRIDFVTVSVR